LTTESRPRLCYNETRYKIPRRWTIHVSHLSLANFRNYQKLELDLPSSIVILQGDNAQGKSNLLESVYLLATTKSQRAAAERELINWSAPTDEPAVARLVAKVEKNSGNVQVELVLTAADHTPEALVRKRIRINGVPRRAIDVVGQVNAVLFGSPDIEIICGSPSLRRRYLDITNSQFDRQYLRSLQRYNKVLQQRNHLLKLIGEQRAAADQLEFWNRELLEHGSYITEQRRSMIDELNSFSQAIHQEISSGEWLQINYLPSASGDFATMLEDVKRQEIARGMTLVGPHRDDLEFVVNDANVGIYGSRGQQRTTALSLRLAESRLLHSKTGEEPVIMLDDVLSELDESRRLQLLSSVTAYRQVLITTTDIDAFEADFISKCTLLRVSGGQIMPV
jgi:DNA replication and repair protein RecF